ncbi:hypothetical protein DFH07DRAFT_991114 [Mycena maculata]|uniref:Uncharacterized protein n=1 Tax=Mycena maculata TaxID=230809 RepID=A0AAD7NSA3_9AGAR|nr:hypothetical protein DFH07DRAFT_991114 [Mycena maculata]
MNVFQNLASKPSVASARATVSVPPELWALVAKLYALVRSRTDPTLPSGLSVRLARKGPPGCYPPLKEISIHCPVSCTHFDFLRIPDLEKLSTIKWRSDYETWYPSCDALDGELASLLASSSRLRSLNLKLCMSGASRQSTTPPSWAAYTALLTALSRAGITRTRRGHRAPSALPSPTSSASVSADGFTPIFLAQPLLTHLVLRAPAHTRRERETLDKPTLPALFPGRGAAQGARGRRQRRLVLAARAPSLSPLSVRFIEQCETLDQHTLPGCSPSVPPTLARLTVRAVVGCLSAPLHPPMLPAASPNLARLPRRRVPESRLRWITPCPSLGHLCLRLYEDVSEHPEAPAEKVSPRRRTRRTSRSENWRGWCACCAGTANREVVR